MLRLPPKKIAVTQEILNRFWAKVNKTETCWLWTGSKGRNSSGLYYGYFRLFGYVERAHRVSFFITYGDFDFTLCILHRCDTTLCVRPEHLFLGTEKDNSDDMISKGRRGYRSLELTSTQIDEIITRHNNGEPIRELAFKLKLGYGTVWSIAHGKWNPKRKTKLIGEQL